MSIKCLIVDDEQLARDMLEAYAQRLDDLQIVGKCKSAMEGLHKLKEEKVDLLLSDIQMPRMTGIDFVQQLPYQPKVIFTTAYADYAIQGFDLEVVDYLLKPIGFERFEKAIQKVKNQLQIESQANAFNQKQCFEEQHILVKEGYDHHKLFLKDIIYIEAMREYIVYHLEERRVMELRPISQVITLLPATHFLRIHRSYIIAKSAVQGHQANKLILKKQLLLPIGKTYKQSVLKELF